MTVNDLIAALQQLPEGMKDMEVRIGQEQAPGETLGYVTFCGDIYYNGDETVLAPVIEASL